MMFIDGLECSIYTRSVLEELHNGKMTCVTNTVSFWENATDTMDELARWRDKERANSDLILIARTAADIRRAYAEGKTAILMGSQNATPIEDRLRWIELFHDMGLRVMQLTYNNQNSIGSSCYEENDTGIARFGKEVIREMNRVGMLIDLSHSGVKTGMDAIEISDKPVAVTHANPSSLYEHRRNKPDEMLKRLAEKGGMLGIATYVNIGGPWCESLDKWCEMIARTVDIMGIDHVGIGTDLGRGETQEYLDWMRHGHWTRTQQFGASTTKGTAPIPPPAWCVSTEDFPAIADALGKKLNPEEVAKVMGGNWLRLYETVFRG